MKKFLSLLTGLSVLACTTSCGQPTTIADNSNKDTEMQEIHYPFEVTTTTSETFTLTTTETTVTTSTEKSLTSPTMTITDFQSEVIPSEVGEPKNDVFQCVSVEPELYDYYGDCYTESKMAEECYTTNYVSGTYVVSDLEYTMLVYLVHHEAGNQSYECKKGVCSTVFNRLNTGAYNSVYDVLLAPNQFTIDWWGDLTVYDDSEAYLAVNEVLAYGSTLPDDVQVFFADYCWDEWLRSRAVYTQYGDTIFAYYYSY